MKDSYVNTKDDAQHRLFNPHQIVVFSFVSLPYSNWELLPKIRLLSCAH